MKNLTVLIEQKRNLSMTDVISLKEVDDSDIRFLFALLKERDPKANISHKEMPTYSTHTNFVRSKPYSKWCIIKLGNSKIGSIYLSKNNEIGIFVKKQFHGKKLGHNALKKFMRENPRKRYLANANPKNIKSQKFLQNNNFKLIQHTYELEK